MQTAPERRSPHHARVPLDDVLVELFPEGFEEGFEADAVDLGNGGLAMRAPLLPDIGSTLRCSFRSPADGQPVDADCEVVWAEDSGPTEGHFGLRFTQLPQDSAEAIGRIVDQWMDVLGGKVEADSGPDFASLSLEGVRSPIVGEVAHRAHDALVVEQELPFLHIGTAVSESGQRQGRLASVDLRVEDDVPRLVLTVVYEDSSPGLESAAEVQPSELDELQASESAALELPLDADSTFRQQVPPQMDPAEDAPRALSESPQERHATREGVHSGPGATEDIDAEDEELARSMTPARDLATLWRRVSPRLLSMRASVVAAWLVLRARALPILRRVGARAKSGLGELRASGLPALAAAVRRVAVRSRGFVTALRARRGGASAKSAPRRSTRAPVAATPRRRPRARTEAAPAVDPRRAKNRRRALLLGLLALGVAGGVWAFSGGDDTASADVTDASAESTSATEAPALAVAAAAAPAVRSPYAVEDPPEPSVDPEAGEQAAPSAPDVNERSYQAGRMESPTFPSIGGAPDSTTRVSSTRFGAEDVTRARNFTLRMSRPVEGLRGEALPDGFRVDVDGSLSLDRAGPIAAAHPFVERATVLNRGDHAELRVRFVSGRHPPYRVEARGSSVVISIGR